MYPPSWFNYVYTSGYFGNRQYNSISLPKGVIIAKMESVESILDRLEKVGEFERETYQGVFTSPERKMYRKLSGDARKMGANFAVIIEDGDDYFSDKMKIHLSYRAKGNFYKLSR